MGGMPEARYTQDGDPDLQRPGIGIYGGHAGANRKPYEGGSAEQSEEALWLGLWSVARYDLGLSEQEFWALSPKKYDALLRRRKSALERNEVMLAQIAQVGVNFGYRAPKEAVKLKEFMLPGWGESRRAEKRLRMTQKRRNHIADHWRAFFSGGAFEVINVPLGNDGNPTGSSECATL